ncbi:MAG: ribokinase [Thermodesulfobacteriota bacterium]
MAKKILVIGSSNIDLIMQIPRFHNPGETILAANLKTAYGGKGANQAIAAKKLGAEVFFLTKLGKDFWGDAYRRYLIKMGLDPRGLLQQRKVPTGMALIELVPRGENRIIVFPGANGYLQPRDLHQNKGIWEETGFLVMQLEIPLPTVKEALHMAKERGLTTILNPAPAAILSRKLLLLVDYLIPNKEEAEVLAGKQVRKKEDLLQVALHLHKKGAKNIIITLGRNGLFFFNGEEQIWRGAFKVKAVDTTAAGDAFVGGFATVLSRGRPIIEALKFANAAGALATTKLGAQPSLPTQKELENFIR